VVFTVFLLCVVFACGETSTWNRRIFDVDESTVLVDREISTLNRRLKYTRSSQILFDVESTLIRRLKIYHVRTDTFRRRIDVDPT